MCLHDHACFQEENDEILKEIKKCQEELRNCALHNISQLKHVLKLAQAEVARNQVRKKLRQTDAEVSYFHFTIILYLFLLSELIINWHHKKSVYQPTVEHKTVFCLLLNNLLPNAHLIRMSQYYFN